MAKLVRFSAFGQFQSMNTSNIENYMKLLNFFAPKSFKPSTINELQIEPKGQPKVLIMPAFMKEDGVNIEFSSNRINFQKVYEDEKLYEDVVSDFRIEIMSIMSACFESFSIVANRLALNYEEMIEDNAVLGEENQYFDKLSRLQKTHRYAGRGDIENESCNIILEKQMNSANALVKYAYDINTIQENTSFRFEQGLDRFYDKFFEVVSEIKEGNDK